METYLMFIWIMQSIVSMPIVAPSVSNNRHSMLYIPPEIIVKTSLFLDQSSFDGLLKLFKSFYPGSNPLQWETDNPLALHNATKDGQAALAQWLRMPMDAPEKKFWLQQLMLNPTVDFNFQNKLKVKINAEAIPSIGYWPIGQFDPERLTELPRPITQVLEMGELESASELLDRKVSLTSKTRDEAIRQGDLQLIRRIFEASDLPDNFRHYYLPAAVSTGSLEIVEYILSKPATARKVTYFLEESEFISVGANGSLEIVDYIMDLLEEGDRLTPGNAQAILYGAIGKRRWDLAGHIFKRARSVLTEQAGDTISIMNRALHSYDPRSTRF
jgi:hypothetical protein